MLSSKLKSWVESHLTRKNKSSDHHRKAGLSNSSGALGGSCVSKEADRITHPAASLVNLVPAVPLCSSSGRSNAGVVIRLQNDFAAAAAAASSGQSGQRHHPSWTQSPVMLAWNTKLARVQQQPRTLFDPPLSPTPPPSASSTIQQKPSPTGSDWTQSTQSFAADSGCGDLGTNEGTLSSAADFTTAESSDRINATPSLSSPESAYSTGCSDGVSPVSQDGIFEPLIQHLHHKQTEPIVPWRRSLLETGPDGSNSPTATQSPARTRPTIRTNPWLPVRTSLTSTSDRASWMTDATPETVLSELSLPRAVKETDIVSSDDELLPGESLSSALDAADRQMDLLCNSLEQLMDEQNLRRSFRRSPPSPAPANAPPTSLLPAKAEVGRDAWDADDQYSQLIRQTEEILLQLENDELLLAARKEEPPAPETARKTGASSGQQRRRLRKTRRRCSSRSSGRDLYSSSESSDCDYSAPTRMSSTSAADWRGYRPARRTSSRSSTNSAKVTPRLNKNARTMTQQQQQQQQQQPPRVDRWLMNSQRSSCAPDDWATEHDRPPSPAPMDPHCHWPVFSPSSRPAFRASTRSYRQSSGSGGSASLAGSCPSSPAVGYSPAYSRQWRQSVNREQQRLESQIAFLRQQLKDVTDDYYYDRMGNTPSTSDSGSLTSLRLK